MSNWNDIPPSWIGRTYIVKKAVLPKVLYRFNEFEVKISIEYLTGLEKNPKNHTKSEETYKSLELRLRIGLAFHLGFVVNLLLMMMHAIIWTIRFKIKISSIAVSYRMKTQMLGAELFISIYQMLLTLSCTNARHKVLHIVYIISKSVRYTKLKQEIHHFYS